MPSCPCTRWFALAVGPSGHPDRSGAQIYHCRLNSSKMTVTYRSLAQRLPWRETVMELGVLFYLWIKAVLMDLRIRIENQPMFPCATYQPVCVCARLCCWTGSGMWFIGIGVREWAFCVRPSCACKFFQRIDSHWPAGESPLLNPALSGSWS